MEVVVYGKPRCPFCVEAKRVLTNKGISFTYIDVSSSEEGKAYLEKEGHKTVPQIYVDGAYWGDSESAASIHEEIWVRKSNGSTELLDLDKIHKVLEWAADGLNVSVSQVELAAQLQFTQGVSTSDIHATLIKSAADLISVDYPDYQYMSARLCVFNLRKKVYGKFEPVSLLDHTISKTTTGKYDKHILEDYSLEEFSELESVIDHSRDLDFAYAGIQQLIGKYLVQNRANGDIFETPQMLYMLIGMCLFAKYPKDTRMGYVKDFYEVTSSFKLSLPTPIMGGVRTPTRQFSSCTLIESGDSLDSINASASAIVKYISQRAGIGINGGAIRAAGSEIRGGEVVSTGVIPFWKYFQTAVKSCSQGGARGGAATMFYPFWHLEVENLLVLKNNKGVEENRIRHLDYGVQFNKLMYQRLLDGGDITLFSPDCVEGMYDAFFNDQELFEKLYTEAEQDSSIKKKVVPAVELFALFGQERAGTGRIYVQNVDHCNTNSPFDAKVAPIRQSNLCVAPETQILTDKGYYPISELQGELANIWNGSEWSEVQVQQTGTDQKLLKVSTKDGYELECTPYHKFYVFDGYGNPYKERRAHELQEGDKLCKFDLPVIEGTKSLEKAYVNGFYSGDGCRFRGKSIVYLYHDKRELQEEFEKEDYTYFVDQPDQKRMVYHMTGLRDKFFVPTAEYSITSRLEWLSGYLDADGCIYRNCTNSSITACSVDKGFLKEVQLMLQTLGVSAKITKVAEEGYNLLPANDGTGEMRKFWCKESYRLLISSCDSYKLLELGLTFNRLKIIKRKPQRDAKQFVKVTSVVDEGRVDDTYCFNEPKRHMGMFGGILTGQCLEIALPTKPLKNVDKEEGEVALCTLSALNLGKISGLKDLQFVTDIAVRALDALLDYQDYPLPAASRSSMNRRTLGIGIINFANWIANKGLKYSDGSANNETHELFEAIQYYCLESSNTLAKEQGACPMFNETSYSKGIMPMDRSKPAVDKLHTADLQMDWDVLRENILKYGLRNSTLTALMPSETSSQVSNATNGIEPPRGLVSVKASKDGQIKQVVPDLKRLKKHYELLWDIPSNKGYLELVGIMQKFVDQAISANTNYDPSKFEDGKVPMQQILEDILMAYKNGVKTLYYHNTRDGASDDQGDEVVEVVEEGCESGGCKI